MRHAASLAAAVSLCLGCSGRDLDARRDAEHDAELVRSAGLKLYLEETPGSAVARLSELMRLRAADMSLVVVGSDHVAVDYAPNLRVRRNGDSSRAARWGTMFAGAAGPARGARAAMRGVLVDLIEVGALPARPIAPVPPEPDVGDIGPGQEPGLGAAVVSLVLAAAVAVSYLARRRRTGRAAAGMPPRASAPDTRESQA